VLAVAAVAVERTKKAVAEKLEAAVQRHAAVAVAAPAA
jgi:hypothetical protein